MESERHLRENIAKQLNAQGQMRILFRAINITMCILTSFTFYFIRAKDAKEDEKQLGESRNQELQDALEEAYLKRKKETELEDMLPMKNQKVCLLCNAFVNFCS